MTDRNDHTWARSFTSATDHMARMRDYWAQQDLITSQTAYIDALWTDRQLRLIDPGKAPSDLSWRERVLYETVEATGGRPMTRGYGPTPEEIASRLRDSLNEMTQGFQPRGDLLDVPRVGSQEWRLRMVLDAASELSRMSLIEVEPPHIAERIRPTQEGCALVQRWRRIWAQAPEDDHVMTNHPQTHRLFGTVNSPIDPNLCFVLMPFRSDFDEVWQDVIQKSVSEAGLKCVRADEIYGTGAIIHDIWGQIVTARVLIAELTGKNPNVFYELGLAHALGRDVVLLTQDMNDVPFDLKHLRVIVYSVSGRGLKKLEQDLQKMLFEVL